jgi:hypothetical protein
MGPVRGIRKRRKTDNNGSASGSSEKEGVVDWWDELSKKINGIFSSSLYIFNLSNYLTFACLILLLLMMNDECVDFQFSSLIYKFFVWFILSLKFVYKLCITQMYFDI